MVNSSIVHVSGGGQFKASCSAQLTGFTLAEVLITLGIIGIVAALTIPGLVTNYRNKSYVNQLKVGISILQEGFQRAMAEDLSGGDIRGTELFNTCNGKLFNDDQLWADTCFPVLARYFKGIKQISQPEMVAQGDTSNIITDKEKCKQLVGKTNKWYYLNDNTKCRGWKNMSYTLLNGSRIDITISDHEWFSGAITLDVNGDAGPNTWGRDTFYLYIMNDGTITPHSSPRVYSDCVKYYGNEESCASKNLRPEDYEQYCSKTSTEDGIKCAARIMNEGWVMNY